MPKHKPVKSLYKCCLQVVYEAIYNVSDWTEINPDPSNGKTARLATLNSLLIQSLPSR